jgi:hypothetical protein
MSPDLLQGYTKVESIAAIFEADPEDSFSWAVDDSDSEKAGGVDDLFDTERALLYPY